MIGFLFKKAHMAKLLLNSNNGQKQAASEKHGYLDADLDKNLKILIEVLGSSPDIIVRRLQIGPQNKKLVLLYLDGMTDKKTINDTIIKPLIYDIHLMDNKETSEVKSAEDIKDILLSVADIKKQNSIAEVMSAFLNGHTVLLMDGCTEALLIDTKGWPNRGIEMSPTERSVRGPREAFTETLRFNTTLLRRKIVHSDFSIEQMVIGEKTNTVVAVAYLKGIANPQLVEEVKRRLERIKTDAILESGYIEQFIEDHPLSVFSTVGNSEKPDTAAARILEGRVAILVDGTPFALTVPMFFIEGFQAAEDYYSRPYLSSMLRLLRFLSFMLSILAPALYVALTTYHPELIPTQLLITMAAADAGTPFPAVLESLGMGLVYEVLREGSIRLPFQIGSALSIVGALIIGDAAVSAGLIGAPMVIVVALTAISSFLAITHTDAGTVLRFIMVILAGVIGIFGIILGLFFIIAHLASMRSFGSPYLTPVSPLSLQGLKDTFIRAPLWTILMRPDTLSELDPQRQDFRLKPGPPEDTQ